MFDIPVVVFAFKRDKVIKILEVVKKINPSKLYILSDGPRNLEEKEQVDACRLLIDKYLTGFSNTEIIRKYEEKNIGVYANIGLGAKWVFSREKMAIFLEDDNLPEITFFEFCREMLLKYENEDKVLWICGTNYLEKYNSKYSYVFTKQMLPCGWASWSSKFIRCYDGELQNFNYSSYKKYKNQYCPRRLFNRFRHAIDLEKRRICDGKKPVSWDYQMDFSIKYYNLYGVCPCNNQIRNIGADLNSIHGGNNITEGFASKFCEKQTYKISFPLTEPPILEIDAIFEKRTGKIMLPTFKQSVKDIVFGSIRKLFRVPYDVKFKDHLRRKRK